MIIDNTYFKNELYIPHAKPSITSDITTVSAELDVFIDKYVRECLIKCLGLQLFREFESQLDKSKANGLKDTADVKWNDLLNGKEYTDSNGNLVYWRGIRFKNSVSDTRANRSFLANYVYFKYEQNYDDFRAGVGVVKSKAKNADSSTPAPKVTRAWREMVDMIQGKEFKETVMVRRVGVGIDYYHENQEVTLYRFIREMNHAVSDTYQNFKPAFWEQRVNQFGI